LASFWNNVEHFVVQLWTSEQADFKTWFAGRSSKHCATRGERRGRLAVIKVKLVTRKMRKEAFWKKKLLPAVRTGH
jgi:heme-degrading monooxygenase HmoA